METLLTILGIALMLFLLVKYLIAKARLEGFREAQEQMRRGMSGIPMTRAFGSGIITALLILGGLMLCLVTAILAGG
jgi:uncharacterized membrane protein YfcA